GFDFEAKASYTIRVRSTDVGGLSTEKVFTINVSDVNEAPIDITPSINTAAEHEPRSTSGRAFSSTDPDAGDSLTSSLASGPGDADNASFTVDSKGNLRTAAAFDAEAKSSYSIRVRSTDAGGLSTEKVFTISVTDVNEIPAGRSPENRAAGSP